MNLEKLNIGIMSILSGMEYMEAQGYSTKYLKEAERSVRAICNRRWIEVEELSEEIDKKLEKIRGY